MKKCLTLTVTKEIQIIHEKMKSYNFLKLDRENTRGKPLSSLVEHRNNKSLIKWSITHWIQKYDLEYWYPRWVPFWVAESVS